MTRVEPNLVHLADTPPADVQYIIRNMRDSDRREVFAIRWNDSEADLFTDVMACGAFGWVARTNKPVAVVGAAPLCRGVWSVYMFATPDFPTIGISLTRFGRRVMIPALLDAGAHRAECLSMADSHMAHRWIEHLGAKLEATLRRRGRNGEDFHLYAWVK